MKLTKARFQNFRLLRNLEIDFSTSPEKRLTVIRAENESGKTTILNALQWVLYGNDALPRKGIAFRISPIDWNIASGNKIPISVEVEFETFGSKKSERKQYRIIRSANEILSGDEYELRNLNVKLFEITKGGHELISHPEALIKDELPTELREVFFTDGDRALDFIAASQSRQGIKSRRERVRMAVRSLLELEIIESALGHVKTSIAGANKSTKGIGQGTDLDGTIKKLDEIEIEITKLGKDKENAENSYDDFDTKLKEVEQKIEMALIKGNKVELEKEIKDTKNEIEKRNKEMDAATKEHSNLFRGTDLARDLLVNILESSLSKLDELRDQGKFPLTAIPILKERLKAGICICGEALNDDTNAKARKQYIEKNIEESQQSDKLQTTMTTLYYGAGHLQPDTVEADKKWTKQYSKIANRRLSIKENREYLEKKQQSQEARLDEIPDTNISALRKKKEEYKKSMQEQIRKSQHCETRLSESKKEKAELELQRDKLLRKQKQGKRILADLEAARDIEKVLKQAYDKITNEELEKVSDYMNVIFLKMIGADPEQGAIIQRTEINQHFDITAYGANDRTLDPDIDLNGASRRALTLAFILALTKVSEAEAPNVIDTPLGMMSGFVKQSVLETVIHESSQLILFLTRSEISDCEEIINKHAGSVITLTNSTHYPNMLKNDPKTENGCIIRCSCKDLSECEICVRHPISLQEEHYNG